MSREDEARRAMAERAGADPIDEMDAELRAMATIVYAMRDLDAAARVRIMTYINARFGG